MLLGDDIAPQKNDDLSEAVKETDESTSLWLANGSSSASPAKEKNHIEFWDTKITKVHPSMLVWAKNNYYSQKASAGKALNYFPARICEEHEVCMCVWGLNWVVRRAAPVSLSVILFILDVTIASNAGFTFCSMWLY